MKRQIRKGLFRSAAEKAVNEVVKDDTPGTKTGGVSAKKSTREKVGTSRDNLRAPPLQQSGAALARQQRVLDDLDNQEKITNEFDRVQEILNGRARVNYNKFQSAHKPAKTDDQRTLDNLGNRDKSLQHAAATKNSESSDNFEPSSTGSELLRSGNGKLTPAKIQVLVSMLRKMNGVEAAVDEKMEELAVVAVLHLDKIINDDAFHTLPIASRMKVLETVLDRSLGRAVAAKKGGAAKEAGDIFADFLEGISNRTPEMRVING